MDSTDTLGDATSTHGSNPAPLNLGKKPILGAPRFSPHHKG